MKDLSTVESQDEIRRHAQALSLCRGGRFKDRFLLPGRDGEAQVTVVSRWNVTSGTLNLEGNTPLGVPQSTGVGIHLA